MTAIQIIQEIEALPVEEQRTVFSSLRKQLEETKSATGEVRYADFDETVRVADRILPNAPSFLKN